MVEQNVARLNSAFGLEKVYSETLQLNHQAYTDDAMRRAAVLKWWKRFRDGETNVKGQNCLFHYPPEACGKRSAARFREVGGAL
jgi:hypothetical protein